MLKNLALVGVAQWIECQPVNERVASSIPSQGPCLGCRLDVKYTLMFLSFSLPSPLKEKKKESSGSNTMGDEMGNFRWDVKIVKNNQMEILVTRMIILEIKSPLTGINRRENQWTWTQVNERIPTKPQKVERYLKKLDRTSKTRGRMLSGPGIPGEKKKHRNRKKCWNKY